MNFRYRVRRRAVTTGAGLLALGLLFAPCARTAGAAQPISAANTKTPIKHVIVIVMENRSFDNVFRGFPGADSASYGREHTGKTIELKAAPYEGNCDPDHSHEAWVKEYNGGRMNGFDTAPASCIGPQ